MLTQALLFVLQAPAGTELYRGNPDPHVIQGGETTTVSYLVGGLIVLALAAIVALPIRDKIRERRREARRQRDAEGPPPATF